MSTFYMGGICGMGMAPLAAFLQEDGNDVSGFDNNPNAEVKKYLQNFGVNVGEQANNLRDFDNVVISTALKNKIGDLKNIGAKDVILRGECWAKVCAKRRLIAIMGSHGKSTVSSLIAHAINKYSLNAGWLTGAIPVGFPMHKHCALREILVSEIDESDGTIENFFPEITVALNADLDHTNTYANWDELEAMYSRLFARTTTLVIVPQSDSRLCKIAKKFAQKTHFVETSDNFNKTNELIARSLIKEAFNQTLADDAFADFQGIKRRQEIIFKNSNATVIADYAHHPTEVDAFLSMFNKRFYNYKKIVIFQPHRYSRTKQFAERFAQVLDYHCTNNTETFVAPVYAASENFDPLGTSEKIVEKSKKSSIVLAKSKEIFKIVNASILKEEKLAVAVVGAGDIYFDAKENLG